MAKAYWIVRVSVHQPAQYPDYLAAARPAFEKFDANSSCAAARTS